MKLEQFESELQGLVGRPSSLRPFVCDGSPLTCTVFIVGINPATSMETDFWTFWQATVGFDKRLWFDDYKRERAARPLKPGRTRRQQVSSTRRVIDLVVDGAGPVRCLETNLFPTATASASELGAASRSTAVFSFLLRAIRPSLIVAHGAPAAMYFSEHPCDAEVWTVKHLSRGWSTVEAQHLGERIRERVSRVS